MTSRLPPPSDIPELDGPTQFVIDLQARISALEAENKGLKEEIRLAETLPDYVLGHIDGVIAAAIEIDKLADRHDRMGHLFSIGKALEAAGACARAAGRDVEEKP